MCNLFPAGLFVFISSQEQQREVVQWVSAICETDAAVSAVLTLLQELVLCSWFLQTRKHGALGGESLTFWLKLFLVLLLVRVWSDLDSSTDFRNLTGHNISKVLTGLTLRSLHREFKYLEMFHFIVRRKFSHDLACFLEIKSGNHMTSRRYVLEVVTSFDSDQTVK